MSALPSLLEFSRTAVSAALEAFVAAQAEPFSAETGGMADLPGSPGWPGSPGAAGFGAAPLLVAVDATCGNGHDTLFMAQTLRGLAGERLFSWRILAFDVQAGALEKARARMAGAGFAENADNGGIDYIHDGHEHVARHLVTLEECCVKAPCSAERKPYFVVAAMYNLGFLPGSDKQVVTREETTLASLAAAVNALAPGGILAVHAYGGHPGGLKELGAADAWFRNLDSGTADVTRYEVCNKTKNPEVLFLAVKKQAR